MAIKMTNSEWCAILNAYRYQFVIDSADDVANLPDCCAGSTAIVAAKDGPMYMVNASGSWEEL